MANNKLFQNLEVSNNVSRNGFDLGNNEYFTAKIGQLLPVWHRTCMLGDSFKLSTKHFTRTLPLQTAALTQIKEYFDWFFVPYRLLWKGAIPAFAGGDNNNQNATSPYASASVADQHPQIPLEQILRTPAYSEAKGVEKGIIANLVGRQDMFGFDRGFNCARLLEMLGYCQVSDLDVEEYFGSSSDSMYYPKISYVPPVSLYPLLAYNKIYYDYLRNTNWEENQPQNYNVDYIGTDGIVPISTSPSSSVGDYWDNPTMFDLRYSTYPKDLFFGVLPNSQSGDESVVELTPDIDGDAWGQLRTLNGSSTSITASSGSLVTAGGPLTTGSQNYLGVKLGELSSSFSILELRRATFLQKYKEIVGSGNQHYSNILKRIFDFELPKHVTNLCEYLGGSTSVINISEEVNQFLQTTSQPVIKGTGRGSNESEVIDFTAQEPGILMCIYHSQPVIHYKLSAFHFDVVKTETDDYANPIFDKLGYQALPHYFFMNNFQSFSGWANTSQYFGELGYTSRYFDYKTSVDRVSTGFRDETRETWLTPLDSSYLINYIKGTGPNAHLELNASFFHVNPRMVDSIFYQDSQDNYWSDHLQVALSVNCSAVRPLDYHGLPY